MKGFEDRLVMQNDLELVLNDVLTTAMRSLESDKSITLSERQNAMAYLTLILWEGQTYTGFDCIKGALRTSLQSLQGKAVLPLQANTSCAILAHVRETGDHYYGQ